MASNYTHSLNLAVQAAKIKSVFPLSCPSINGGILSWKHNITPTPLSATYEVKLSYTLGKHPRVFVTKPKLELFPGETKLQHVYDTDKQWICIYYKPGREWDSNMHIADTIIPWTSEWLLHYECWLATGTWHGGGIHNLPKVNNQVN